MPVELTKPTPSTAADKAAALTFLKINYNWPKSVQFGSGEDASNYALSFVTNQTNGTIAMNVIKTFKDMTSEHYGTAYLDAMIMANMNESERTELVSSAASLVIDDHIKSKKAFIESQMQAIKMGQGSQTAKGTAQLQQQAESNGKSAFAGLLGALGAIGSGMGGFAGLGSGMGGFAGLGLVKEAVESQKLIQDLQNQQAKMVEQTLNPPVVKPVFVTMPSIPKSVKDAMKKPVADDGFKDTSNDEQKFIQRVGVMSNLNVSIQGKERIGITVYRLFCDKCKTPQDIEAGVITQRRHEDKVLVEFCNAHRHVAIVPQSEGERKFKDV
jgi:RNase P subunit RPR2